MRLLVSRFLIGLLVSGWLSIDFGRGSVNLALELIPGLLEFSRLWPRPRRSSPPCWQHDPAGLEQFAATRAAFKGFCWGLATLDTSKP